MEVKSEPDDTYNVTHSNENQIKMEVKSELDDNDVTHSNANLSPVVNDKDGKDENGCEKDTTNDAAEATEATEVEKKEINNAIYLEDQDDKNDMVNGTDSAETPNITIGAMNTQVKKKRRKRKACESPVNKDSEPNKVINPLNSLKRKRCRTRTRSARNKSKKLMEPVSLDANPISENVESEPSIDVPTYSIDDVEYCLTVSNLPVSWSFMEIKNYFDTEVGPVDEIEMIKDDKTGFGAIRLSYQTEKECNDAKQKLQDKVVAGNKLALEMAAVTSETDTETNSETTNASTKPWKPDLDSWEVDLNGMYGLKLQFLKSLGITPPLDKWVHVSNFRCDKSELRDILELAGNVQMCSVFTVSNRYANVMYSHPLEAVQAVSMLNNQVFYGQTLKVTMDRSPANTVLLPKGLSAIGCGLGLNGKPLRNIVKHYERFLESKECLVNPVAFNVPENSVKNTDVKFEVKSVEDFIYPIVKAVKAPPPTSTVKTVQAPKPPQTPSPKPKVQAPAYTKTPVSVPVSKPSQSREVTPYTTFVAPQTNNGNFRPQGLPNLMSTPIQPPGQSAPFLGPPRPMRPESMGQGPMGPGPMGPGPMGQGPMGQGPMGQGPMGPGPMGQGPMGPGPMGQGPMGPGPMGPGPMGPGPMGPGPMGPGPMGPGPMGQGPMGPRPMGPGPMGPRPMGPGPMGPRQMSPGPMGPGPMGPRPMGPRPIGPGQMGPGPMGPRPMGPGQMGPGPMGPRPMGPGPMRPPGSFDNEPVKMILSNLPPSTTFPLLCDKMSHWGHVVCLQLTTPGCAVVTFGNRMQADACFQHYNGRSIDNHIIQMQYA